MKVVSLGCNCKVGYFIKHNFAHEYYPFEWIWSTLDFVIRVFEEERIDFMECEKLNTIRTHNADPNLNWNTSIFNNGCKGGVERICTSASIHDADNMTEEEYIANVPVINERYKRRMARLLDTLNGEEPIMLVRKTLEKDQQSIQPTLDTAEDLNHLAKLLKKFKAPITLCVLDEEKYIDRTKLNDIQYFDSFHNLWVYLKGF
jgi:hypothetical protein